MTEFAKALEAAIEKENKMKVMMVLDDILEHAIAEVDGDLIQRTLETIYIMKEEELEMNITKTRNNLQETKNTEEMEIMQNEIKEIQKEEFEREFNHIQELNEMADKEMEDWVEEIFEDPVFGRNTKEEEEGKEMKYEHDVNHEGWMLDNFVFVDEVIYLD